jgi:hypothetical protein
MSTGPKATMADVMAEVWRSDLTDAADRHAAVLAYRDEQLHKAKLATLWAESIRVREAAATSQRKAAAKLGVSRGAVRPKK